MDDEPTLPRFSRANPIARRLDERAVNTQRKRVREDTSPPFSSDPPLFSSDDDPSAENYTTKRRKKKYRGPWYRQQPASDPASETNDHIHPTKEKRTLARQFDSGVWLGSDGSDDSFAEDFLSPEEDCFGNPSAPINLSPRQIRKVQYSLDSISPEGLARKQIGICLDEGLEDIVLSSLVLTSISNSTISPLSTFTCQPKTTTGVNFESLVPNLRLFLQSNRLNSLPASLFNLDRLTFLTLRDNQFQELPPSIGNLHNLRELNISQNALRYLPFEILQLVSIAGSLRSLQMHPNPFFEAKLPDIIPEEEDVQPLTPIFGKGQFLRPRTPQYSNGDVHLWSPKWHVAYRSRTQVRFRDITGALVKGPIFPTDSPQDKLRLQSPSNQEAGNNMIPVAEKDDKPIPPIPRGNFSARVPSLLEVALNACSKTAQLPYLSDLLPQESPVHLSELLEQTASKKASGGSKCTICKRNYIIPRTEWIEFWEITRRENRSTASAASPLRQMENERDLVESMLPLMRRGCSWFCVPGSSDLPVDIPTPYSVEGERSMYSE